MPIQAPQPVNAFFAGRKQRQDEDYANSRNQLAQLDAQNAPIEADQRQQMNALNIQQGQNQQAQYSKQQIDESLQKTAAAAMHIAQSPTPVKDLLGTYQDFARTLAQAHPEITSYNDKELAEFMKTVAGHAQSQLGIAPPQPKTPEAFTLSEGQQRFGPNGQPVASVPKSNEMTPYQTQSLQLQRDNAAAGREQATATREAASTNQNFSRADKLRDEFNAQSKDFVTVGDAYSKVQAAAQDPSAAGDLALIFSYMKILDPGSVVREQEFANAQNAGGIPDRIRSTWNKALDGERLSPNQRKDFINQAKKTYQSQETRSKVVAARYTKMATDFGIDPKYVVSEMGVQPESQQPQQGQAPHPTAIQSLLDKYK